MAALALPAKPPIVHVFIGMATNAGSIDQGPAINRLLVAVITFCLLVSAIKRKAGFSMVEIPGFPCAGVVTCFAARSKTFLVDILFFMTDIAE